MSSPHLLAVVDVKPDCAFHAWRRDVHSQKGEDGIIETLMRRIGVETGYFVEFGAWDGRHLSNTAKLADEGWRGCFIEGSAERFPDLVRNYAGNDRVSCLHRFVEASGPNGLDALLASVGAPAKIDILSIDIDGNDYHVWAGLTAFAPTLVVIEYNPTIPARVAYVQEYDATLSRGASLTALDQLARARGYVMVAATELNGFFMKADIAAAAGLRAYTPAEVKDTSLEAAIFHGYDGTIFTAGERRLVWHGIEFAPDEFQILPEELRRLPIAQPEAYFEALQQFIVTWRARAASRD